MAEKPVVTNAMRLLKAAGIEFETREYEVDENDLSGVHAAEVLGLPPEEVFKTLVLRGEKQGILVCVLPVELEVDLKKLAKEAGDKKVEMIHMKELLPLTGYIRGGCSPVGMKKKYPTFLDETCELCERISVSAGQRGVQMLLRPEDLARYTEAKICDIAQ
ncbi:MAG: Cys-tRNA(Pro) deacylase [Candidatus Spyradocola sp.]|jgi:Cys-tRNA(Pro)/Cys-tRNA(Cys) deacylase